MADPLNYADPLVPRPLPPRWLRVLAWALVVIAAVLVGIIAIDFATRRVWH